MNATDVRVALYESRQNSVGGFTKIMLTNITELLNLGKFSAIGEGEELSERNFKSEPWTNLIQCKKIERDEHRMFHEVVSYVHDNCGEALQQK